MLLLLLLLFVLQKEGFLRSGAANKTAHSEQMKAKWNDKYLVFVKTLIKIMLHPLIIYLYRTKLPPLPRKRGVAMGVCACVDNKTIIPPCWPELLANSF